MHAYIVSGSTSQARQKKIQKMIADWNIVPSDVVELSTLEASIGIAQARDFQKRLTLMPYASPYTIGIIHDMHLLTTEAQNALLKTLEEPPPHAKLIGVTDRLQSLLPTILSRCELITLITEEQQHDEAGEEMQKTIRTLLTQSPGQMLQTLEPFEKTRDEAKVWVEMAIAASRLMLLDSYTTSNNQISRGTITSLIKKLLKAQFHLSANVSPKLALDMVFLG